MEIKDRIVKPYTENERMDFIIEQNHNKGYEIASEKGGRLNDGEKADLTYRHLAPGHTCPRESIGKLSENKKGGKKK